MSPQRNGPLNIADLPDFPETDETGDVDMSLIDSNLQMSVADRITRHNQALEFVRALQKSFKERYGLDAADVEETE